MAGPNSVAAGAGTTWPNLGYPPYGAGICLGISYLHSQITLAMVRDGASSTYMLGEKYLDPNTYANGADPGDNKCLYAGFAQDTNRGFGWPLMPDQAGTSLPDNFGGAHTGSFNMIFCDGSMHAISYSIDQLTHQLLSCINDGQAVDTSGL